MRNEKVCTAQTKVQLFEKMHLRLKGAIERYVFYLTGKKHETEDIAQEIFIKLWNDWGRLAEMKMDELEDFIYVMVRNYIINEQRKSRRKFRRRFRQYLDTRCDWYLHDEIVFAEGVQLYHQAVNKLPERMKIPYLYYEDDYRSDEIAATINRSVYTVNNQLTSAYKSVKEYLNKTYGINFRGRRQLWKPESLN